jgi:DNA invertase Pin-like site-specific DNA recombinase
MKTAYSYVRFSSKKQAEGDSERRQTDGWAEEWAAKHDSQFVALKPDRGVSSFKGRNHKRGKFAAFLREIEAGLIPKGSVLLVENLDRITREQIDPATDLIKRILRAGVTIVTRSPEETFRPEDVNDLGKTILLAAWMYRNNSESELKGVRVAATKENIRKTGFGKYGRKIKKCPAWLRLSDDGKSYGVIADKAATVKKIFRLAADGYGVQRLTKKLTAERIPSLFLAPWNRSSLLFLLRSRTVLGEFQNHVGYGSQSDRKPVGEPIEDYYPRVVEEELFYRVQAQFAKRAFGRPKKGQKGHHLGQKGNGRIEGITNLFSGLAVDARDDSRFRVVYGPQGRRFVSYAASMGRVDFASIPYDVFETVFLTWTKELRTKDVLPVAASELEESLSAKEARLDEINAKIQKLQEKLLGVGDVETLSNALIMLDKEKKSVQADLERLKAEFHSSKSASLRETQELIELLNTSKGEKLAEIRQRLKSRIAQLVSEIRILTEKHGQRREVVVQVFFEGGKRRSLQFEITPVRKNAKEGSLAFQRHFTIEGGVIAASNAGGWRVVVMGEVDLDERRLLNDGDLRNPEHVQLLAEAMAG